MSATNQERLYNVLMAPIVSEKSTMIADKNKISVEQLTRELLKSHLRWLA